MWEQEEEMLSTISCNEYIVKKKHELSMLMLLNECIQRKKSFEWKSAINNILIIQHYHE